MGKVPNELFEGFVRYMPILTVDGVVRINGRIVLVRRDIEPYKGYWHLPGGVVMKGERVSQALSREIFEETGLKIKVDELVGVYDDPARDPRGHWISLCFLTNALTKQIRGSEEGEIVGVFEKLPTKVGFDHRKMLNDAGYF